MSRPHHTAADYAAIAIAPLLIFVMLFSLSSFLCLVLYSGNFIGRLMWIMLMYCMGATAVARIMIEESRQYASVYAIALGAATLLVLLRFVGDPIFGIGLLWFIGYLADKIVHDCTIIDDDLDSSGQGLIDSGLAFLRLKKKQSQAVALEPNQSAMADEDARKEEANQGEANQTETESKKRASRKGHQPGRTVLLLALGALPLFGLGQFFLGGNQTSWSIARMLLSLYLFSALSLLVVTSFLNLRRYLRQRQAEMPLDATIAWLAGGIVIIGLILAIAYVAPLPGRAIASMRPPSFLNNRKPMSASEYGWGNEGAEQGDENDAQSDVTRPDGKPSGKTESGAPAGGTQGDRKDGPAGQDPGGDKQGKGKDPGGDQKPGGQKKSGGKEPPQGDANQPGKEDSPGESQESSKPNQPADKQPAGEKTKPNDAGQPNDADQPNDANQSDQSEEPKSNQSDQQDSSPPAESSPESAPKQPSDPASDQEQQQQQNQQQKQSNNNASSSQQQSEPMSARTPPSSPPSFDAIGSFLSGMLKWLIFLGLFLFIAIFIFRNIDAILAWWNNLFAGEDDMVTPTQTSLAAPTEPVTPPRPFASFQNPVGDADSRRVVVVTFQALEAWCREQGVERARDETPSEFVRRVAAQFPALGQSAIRVVDAYNRIVYGRSAAASGDVEAADSVWRTFASGTGRS